MIGLAGRHILEGEFPLFFYGYGYIGSLKSFLAAGLFALFGASDRVLLLLPALFYIGFALTTYGFVALVADRKAARIALLLTIFASQWITLFSAEIVGGYIDTLFYGNLLLIFLHTFCFGKKPWLGCLALGLISGLAFWQFPLSGYYLITVGFCSFILRPKNILSSYLPLFAVSFFVGSLPFWLYNIFHDFISFKMISAASFSEFFAHLKSFFVEYLPAILGWGFQADTFFRMLGWVLIGILFFVSLVWLFVHVKRDRLNPKAPLLVLFFLSLILFARNNYVGERSPMVVLPLLFIFPAAMGLFLSYLSQKTKIIFWSLLALLVSLYGWETYATCVGREQNAFLFNQTGKNILLAIEKAGLTHIYAPYALAPLISFQTQEKIVAGNFGEEPIPGYKEKLDGSTQPGFLIVKKQALSFEKNLKFLGCSFQKEAVENHVLFYDIKKVRGTIQEISPASWQGPQEAFDRNWVTRWTPHEPQKPGQIFNLDLGQAENLTGLELRSIDPKDLPRSLKIEISTDGCNWKEVAQLPFTPTPLYFSDTHPLTDLEQGRLEIFFEPVKTHYLRLTQIGKSPTNYWSIHELFLFEPKAKEQASASKPDLYSLVATLNRYQKNPIYTDTGLSAQLNLHPQAKKLKILPLYNPRLNMSLLKPRKTQLSHYIDWDKNPLFVIHKDKHALFESSSLFNPNEWEKQEIDSWLLYQKKPTETKQWMPLKKNSWLAEAFPHPDRAHRAIDNRKKVWETFDSQKKGMHYLLNLGKEETFEKIELSTGKSFWEYPRHFKLLASSDKKNWREIEIKEIGLPYWDGNRLLQSQLHERILPVEIEPTTTRYLKIELTQDTPHNQWSLSEINLYH